VILSAIEGCGVAVFGRKAVVQRTVSMRPSWCSTSAGAVLDPVAVVAVPDAVDQFGAGRMDMTADDAVEVAAARLGDRGVLKGRDIGCRTAPAALDGRGSDQCSRPRAVRTRSITTFAATIAS